MSPDELREDVRWVARVLLVVVLVTCGYEVGYGLRGARCVDEVAAARGVTPTSPKAGPR